MSSWPLSARGYFHWSSWPLSARGFSHWSSWPFPARGFFPGTASGEATDVPCVAAEALEVSSGSAEGEVLEVSGEAAEGEAPEVPSKAAEGEVLEVPSVVADGEALEVPGGSAKREVLEVLGEAAEGEVPEVPSEAAEVPCVAAEALKVFGGSAEGAVLGVSGEVAEGAAPEVPREAAEGDVLEVPSVAADVEALEVPGGSVEGQVLEVSDAAEGKVPEVPSEATEGEGVEVLEAPGEAAEDEDLEARSVATSSDSFCSCKVSGLIETVSIAPASASTTVGDVHASTQRAWTLGSSSSTSFAALASSKSFMIFTDWSSWSCTIAARRFPPLCSSAARRDSSLAARSDSFTSSWRTRMLRNSLRSDFMSANALSALYWCPVRGGISCGAARTPVRRAGAIAAEWKK